MKQLDLFEQPTQESTELYRVQWKELEDKGHDMLTGKFLGFSDKVVIKTTRRAMSLNDAKSFVHHLETFIRYYQKWYKIIPVTINNN
jgi:hypothetical protein